MAALSTDAEDSGTFSYANPGTINWGPGCVSRQLDGELERVGATRAFVITTRSVAANPALLGSLRTQLGARCVGVFSAIGQHAPAASVGLSRW